MSTQSGHGAQSITHVVKIDIDASVVCKDKVSNRVCPLDGMRVIVKGAQKPWILGSYELARFGIGPHL